MCQCVCLADYPTGSDTPPEQRVGLKGGGREGFDSINPFLSVALRNAEKPYAVLFPPAYSHVL